MAKEECLRASHDGANCSGEVTGRQASTCVIMECDFHMRESNQRNRETDLKYGVNSDVPPAWFDPAYAGESWDEDY